MCVWRCVLPTLTDGSVDSLQPTYVASCTVCTYVRTHVRTCALSVGSTSGGKTCRYVRTQTVPYCIGCVSVCVCLSFFRQCRSPEKSYEEEAERAELVSFASNGVWLHASLGKLLCWVHVGMTQLITCACMCVCARMCIHTCVCVHTCMYL